MSKAVANLTQSTETITFSAQDNGETISVNITEAARGAAGAAGPAGPNEVTSATTSDGTANLSLSNVTTATAEVTGTLTADHIHGNLAGSVYAHVRAGEALSKGDPVYVSGSHGAGENLIAIVSLADAGDPLKMPAVGIMDADVAQNANGHMVITGTISDIDTSAFQVNDELYVNADPGPIDPRFTSTPPTALAQPVARVERANANNGAIIVKVNGLSASDATGNTLVRRTSAGGASFASLSSTGLSVASGTITTSQPLSLTQTWNAGAVTFKGIDVNITDTSSASGSLLMDLRVGGVSKLSASKSGELTAGVTSVSSLRTQLISSGGSGYSTINFGSLDGGSPIVSIISQAVRVRSAGAFQWSNDSNVSSQTTSLALERDAANTLAQRNGTNAQATRVYDTYTSATDYHRLAIATARATATAMSGATITLTNIIPAGAVVVGVTCKVTTAITGATSFDIGTATDIDRFGAAIAVALGTTSDNRNWTAGTIECFPTATSLILTANGSNFTAGAVYVSVQYLSGQAD